MHSLCASGSGSEFDSRHRLVSRSAAAWWYGTWRKRPPLGQHLKSSLQTKDEIINAEMFPGGKEVQVERKRSGFWPKTSMKRQPPTRRVTLVGTRVSGHGGPWKGGADAWGTRGTGAQKRDVQPGRVGSRSWCGCSRGKPEGWLWGLWATGMSVTPGALRSGSSYLPGDAVVWPGVSRGEQVSRG